MPADRDRVRAQLAQRDIQESRRLHAVHDQQRAALFADFSQLGKVDAIAVAIGDPGRRHDARFLVYLLEKSLDRQPPVAILHDAQIDAVLLPALPHPDVRHVVHVGEHDVVAGLQVKRMRHDVEAFGGVFRECNRLGRATQKIGHHHARRMDVFPVPGVFARVQINVLGKILQHAFDAERHRRLARDVHVSPVRERGELAA